MCDRYPALANPTSSARTSGIREQVHIRSTLKVSKYIFDDIPIEECWRKNVSGQEIHSKWDVDEQQRKQCAEQESFGQQEFVVLQKQVDESSGQKRKEVVENS